MIDYAAIRFAVGEHRRRAALAEMDRWVEACRASLCFTYRHDYHALPVLGAVIPELCNHQWCHGILDALNRANYEYGLHIPSRVDGIPWLVLP